MKRSTLARILKGSSNRRMLLAVGILSTLANNAFSLSANAQSYPQDSYLPPEVIPVNPNLTYNSRGMNSTNVNSLSAEQALQTPQEARQALYHSLMGNNIYPQFTGQSLNQNNNFTANNNMNANQSTGQSMPQTWTTSVNPQTNMSFNQNSNANIAPAQAQMLSGNVATQTTSKQRTTGGISHATGVFTGLAFNAFALASMRSPGGIYSAGLLGAGTMNYGLRNGFRF